MWQANEILNDHKIDSILRQLLIREPTIAITHMSTEILEMIWWERNKVLWHNVGQ